MSFRDSLITVLAGGLPALLDDPAAGPGQTVGGPEGSTTEPRRVEEVAPTGTLQDREPFLMSVTQNQILIGTAGVLGLIALVMIVRK